MALLSSLRMSFLTNDDLLACLSDFSAAFPGLHFCFVALFVSLSRACHQRNINVTTVSFRSLLLLSLQQLPLQKDVVQVESKPFNETLLLCPRISIKKSFVFSSVKGVTSASVQFATANPLRLVKRVLLVVRL